MYNNSHKKEHHIIDGTPEKRLFLSIISDYGLRTGLFELVDNAIDCGVSNGKSGDLKIDIYLDAERQIISVTDNAGGIKEPQLRLLVAPGASGNKANQELIGIFGVGGKRAGIALGERVEIRTRFKKEQGFQVDITTEWIESEDWSLAAYEIENIGPGTTTVDISKLRQSFTENDITQIFSQLSETYAWFINQGCTIRLNGTTIAPSLFENWSYPPTFEPRQLNLEIYPTIQHKVLVEINAGLISDRDPELENYGVYIYCNNRLITKELKSREVGYFVSSEAGVPHPDASLCRVIVKLQGPAEVMPWNSSKSNINFNHPSFSQIRPTLISLVSYFSSLSRRLKGNWEENVLSHTSGDYQKITKEEILSNRKIVLPKLPRVRALPKSDELKIKNKKILLEKPWTLGLVESFGLIEVIMKQRLETKNRAALILLDSNLEIGLKEFIVSRTDIFKPNIYDDNKISNLFKARHQVISEITKHIDIPQEELNKIRYYYSLRNKLIHERATIGITDSQIIDYQKTVTKLMKLLFGLRF